MFRALTLVRNLESSAKRLDFVEFTISRVGPRFGELRGVLSSADVNRDDWIFEKSYTQLPLGPPGSPVGGIPKDVEDILLLLGLYKAGDISFIKQAIIQPSGKALVQLPYRAINDLNSYSPQQFKVDSEGCQSWKDFADGLRESQSWSSSWFAAARRFFLSGGAKQFNPKWDEVDRIVDYATALESTVVPEKDFNRRRISRRAASLLAPDDPAEAAVIVSTIKRLYDIRSTIVHSSRLRDEDREWLLQNCVQVEIRVRQVLVAAVEKLPPGEDHRIAALAALYDLTDQDRGDFVFGKFREIKAVEVRKAVASKIAELITLRT
jgi:hypothetical protein